MNTSTIPYGVSAYFSTDLLLRVIPNFEFVKFATISRDIPQNKTAVIKWRRHGNLTAKTTALTEGVTPSASAVSVTDITATVAQYGDYIVMTDVVNFTSDDPNLNDWNQIQADQAADTLDLLTRTEIYGGSTVQYASTATQRSEITSVMKLTGAEVREAVRTLKVNKAKKITEMIKPTASYNTSPVNACYIGFVHPNASFDLKNDGLFVPVEKYSSQMGVMDNEIGKLDEVRFIETTQCPVYTGEGSSTDAYATLIIAKGYYGISRIAGKAMENIFKPLGSAGAADPLNQRATKAWKAWFVAKRLNEAFAVRIEHSVSA